MTVWRWRIRPVFAWFDLWVGVFVDRPKRRIYILPLPMVGIVIEWPKRMTLTEELSAAGITRAGIEGLQASLRKSSRDDQRG
jgi:hypothetical protein